MSLGKTLQNYAGEAGDTGQSAPKPPETGARQSGELPVSVQEWPAKWRQQYDAATGVITKLLPINILHAEAAAEITLRSVYAHQHAEDRL